MAILVIHPDMLRQILQLPDGAEIVRVQSNDQRGVLEIFVDGCGWPTGEGALLVRTTGIVTSRCHLPSGETYIDINWGFPK